MELNFFFPQKGKPKSGEKKTRKKTAFSIVKKVFD